MISIFFTALFALTSLPCTSSQSKNIENDYCAFPCASGFESVVDENIVTETDIPDVLCDFVSDGDWNQIVEKTTADVFGGEPQNIEDGDEDCPFNIGKTNLNMSYNTYVGCGKNALYCVMEYLGLYANYHMLGVGTTGYDYYPYLGQRIIQNTTSYSITQEAIYVDPVEMCNSFEREMSFFGYNNVLDASINTISFSALKSSIDDGYPVIIGSVLNNDIQYSHYFVIYGYDIWAYTDNYDIVHEYPVFLARFNLMNTWGDGIYVHPKVWNYLNYGIFFHEMREVHNVDEYQITNQCSYPFSEQSYSAQTKYGYITGNYLRTGMILDADNNEYLTMSSRRSGAGTAYITFNFTNDVSNIYFKASLWGTSENFDFYNDYFVIETYSTVTNTWTTALNVPLYLVTSNRQSPLSYMKVFDLGCKTVRMRVVSSAVGDRNKGRIVLSNVMFVGSTFLP